MKGTGMAVIVALVSQKGGVGKSTLARGLGTVAAAAGLEVTIVDLDPQQQTVMAWHKLRSRSRHRRKILVEAFDDIELALEEADECDLLILDMPARASRITLDVARRVHLVVQPSAGSLDDLRPAVLLFHELTRAGIPRSRLVLALTRILDQREEQAARAYADSAGYEVLPGSITEHARYRDAQNEGRAVNETGDGRLDEHSNALLAALLKSAVDEAKGARKRAGKAGKEGAA